MIAVQKWVVAMGTLNAGRMLVGWEGGLAQGLEEELMKKVALFGAILLSLAVGAAFVLRSIPAKVAPGTNFGAALPSGVSPTRIDIHGIAQQISDESRPVPNHGTVGMKSGASFPGVSRSRMGMPLAGDPFVAESRAEQAWLDRNGFPNSDQLLAYSKATDVALAQAAAQGDRVARVTLEGRRLIRGDPEAATDLWSSAVDGSGYALTTLAGFLGGSRTYGDPKSAYAVSRLAEMRGDYRQAIGRNMLLQSPLSPVERIEAEGQAMRMLIDFNQARRKRYGSGVSLNDPRPIAPDGP